MLCTENPFRFAHLTWLVCALLGCRYERAEFSYGKAEMEGQVIGRWTGTWLPADGPASTFTLELDSVNDPSRRRTACGRQTFSAAPAPGVELACDAGSSLAVSGTLSAADAGLSARELSGSFEVMGIDLNPGHLMLESNDRSIWLSANQNESYDWEGCEAVVDGAHVACTLDSLEAFE